MMAPVFAELNGEEDKVKFCKVNVDEQPNLASMFGIDSIPTLAVVQDRHTLTADGFLLFIACFRRSQRRGKLRHRGKAVSERVDVAGVADAHAVGLLEAVARGHADAR